ncbi:MAG TPA: hypothetical protein VGF39_14390 [Stellaceae bacterium]
MRRSLRLPSRGLLCDPPVKRFAEWAHGVGDYCQLVSAAPLLNPVHHTYSRRIARYIRIDADRHIEARKKAQYPQLPYPT